MSMKIFSDLSNHLGSNITQREGARGGNHHYCPSFNPLTYPGGGDFGPDHQIIDHNSKLVA